MKIKLASCNTSSVSRLIQIKPLWTQNFDVEYFRNHANFMFSCLQMIIKAKGEMTEYQNVSVILPLKIYGRQPMCLADTVTKIVSRTNKKDY